MGLVAGGAFRIFKYALIQIVSLLVDFPVGQRFQDGTAWFVAVAAVIEAAVFRVGAEFGKAVDDFLAAQVLQAKGLKARGINQARIGGEVVGHVVKPGAGRRVLPCAQGLGMLLGGRGRIRHQSIEQR